jgi:hypothetical protein
MTGQELYLLCKSLADDPDETFFSKQKWANALQAGYASYQQYICNSVPEIFEKQFDFTLLGSQLLTWTGTPVAGDVASITVASPLSTLTYSYTVALGDTMADVATALTALAAGNPFVATSNVGAVTQVLCKTMPPAVVTSSYTGGTGSVLQAPVPLAEVSMDGVIFGDTPYVGKVAYRISKMHTVNAGQSPDFGLWVQPAGTMEQLWNITSTTGYGNFNPGKWLLQGTVLKFNIQQTSLLRMYYIPNGPGASEWLTLISSPGQFVDNTPDFAQQCIAYFAYSQYAIQDWATNPELQAKFGQLLQQLDRWLARNRTGDAHRWVQPGRQGLQGGGGWW